jgi:phenylalanyl-tRNA synthetase beta chain
MLPGLELATKLILDLCGGRPTDILVAGEIPQPKTTIDFPITEVKRLTGIEVHNAEALKILDALGFTHRPGRGVGNYVVTVPTWRPDATAKADLVEEVVRIIGLDKVASTAMDRPVGVGRAALTPIQQRTRRAKRALAARGLVEAVTWSFISHARAEAFGGGDKALVLANPIAAEMSDMRPSLFPGLIAAAQRNADRGAGDLALFEVGQIYRGDKPDDQVTAATGLRTGSATVNGSGRHWSGAAAGVSVFDAKADALALLDALGISPDKVQVSADAPDWYHPGRSGVIRQGPKTIIGTFGEFHPKVLERLDAKAPLAGFEIILDAIPLPKAKPTKTKAALVLSDLQPVKRDFAFVIDRSIEVAKVVKAAESADRKLIVGAQVFDAFESDALGRDKKSVAIEVTLQPVDRTMTDQEIEAVAAKVVAAVEEATGGTLRT